jgi:hypothetical protein
VRCGGPSCPLRSVSSAWASPTWPHTFARLLSSCRSQDPEEHGGDEGGGGDDDEDNKVEPRSTRGRVAKEWPRPAADAKAEVQEGKVAEAQAAPVEAEAEGGAAVEAVTAPAVDEGEDEAAPAYVAALAFLEEHAPPVEPRPVRPTIGLPSSTACTFADTPYRRLRLPPAH